MSSLIYIADPMCAWCYGFGPELYALLGGLPGIKLDIVVGGLRPYSCDVIDEETRNDLAPQWGKVREMSGLPLSEAPLQRDDFTFNTEPACRAIAAARALAPESSLAMLHALQHVFFSDGLDITRNEVLAEVGAAVLKEFGHNVDAATFLKKLTEVETVDATAIDFKQTRNWGISGFPTLVLERDGRLDLVTSGFMRTQELVERMQAIIDQPVS